MSDLFDQASRMTQGVIAFTPKEYAHHSPKRDINPARPIEPFFYRERFLVDN